MAIEAHKIEALILAAFPSAKVEITDLAGDGNHYAASVVASEFKGLNRVKQHQLVYGALKDEMAGSKGALHALALTTKAAE